MTITSILSCPFCKDTDFLVPTGVCIGDGTIFKCYKCKGYSLHPAIAINYSGSDWTSMRHQHWQEDKLRGKLYATRILDFLVNQLEVTVTSVLEIGCGSGFMGPGFLQAGCDYAGIELDHESVRFAREQGLNIKQCAVEDLVTISPMNTRHYRKQKNVV